MEKTVNFKWIQNDGRIELGVPEEIVVKNGNYRDGGCALQFTTSEFSIGTKENFELYLFAEDINRITKEIWESYLKTEPMRAKKDFEMICKKMSEQFDSAQKVTSDESDIECHFVNCPHNKYLRCIETETGINCVHGFVRDKESKL